MCNELVLYRNKLETVLNFLNRELADAYRQENTERISMLSHYQGAFNIATQILYDTVKIKNNSDHNFENYYEELLNDETGK